MENLIAFAKTSELGVGAYGNEELTGLLTVKIEMTVIPYRLPIKESDDVDVLLTLRGEAIDGIILSLSGGRRVIGGHTVLLSGVDLKTLLEGSITSMVFIRYENNDNVVGSHVEESPAPKTLTSRVKDTYKDMVYRINQYYSKLAFAK